MLDARHSTHSLSNVSNAQCDHVFTVCGSLIVALRLFCDGNIKCLLTFTQRFSKPNYFRNYLFLLELRILDYCILEELLKYISYK